MTTTLRSPRRPRRRSSSSPSSSSSTSPPKAVGKKVRDTVPRRAGQGRARAGPGSGTRCTRCSPTCRSGPGPARCCSTGSAASAASRRADRLIALGLLFTAPDGGDRPDRVGGLRGRATSGAPRRDRARRRQRRRDATLFGASLARPQARRARHGQAARAGGRRRCWAPAATSAATSPTPRASASTRRRSRRRPEEWTAGAARERAPRGRVPLRRGRRRRRHGRPPRGRDLRARPTAARTAAARCDEGELADGCVTCPLHGSRLQARRRQRRARPGARTRSRRWEVRVRDGVIELKPPA